MPWLPPRAIPTSIMLAMCIAAASIIPASAQKRNTIMITGSSTVYPFTKAVTDVVMRNPAFPRVEIESTGTVHGFNKFCQGAGLRHPDIQNASRQMNAHEFRLCVKNGVHEIMEIPVGFDGIVVAHQKGLTSPDFTLAQLWLGVAKEIPRDGRLVPNPNTTWRQVSPALPDWPIRVIGPPPTSGTRDSFTDLVLSAGCQAVPEVRSIADIREQRRVCMTVREDGRWIDGSENDEATVREVANGPAGTLGIFGYSFLEENTDKVESASIQGVDDTREAITSGHYPISRPLFVYVKRANFGLVPGLKDLIAEYISDRAMGPEGYLIRKGLVPLDTARLRQIQHAVRNEAIILPRSGG